MVKLDLQCCFLHAWFYQQWAFFHFQTLSRGLTIFGEKSLFFLSILWIIYLLNIMIVFCSYLTLMCFQIFLYEGETVGRWTGTEGASDYGNHVSSFTDSVALD